MEFFIYRQADGRVISVSDVPEYDYALQSPPDGCAMVIGHAELGQRYINGELLDAEEQQ